MEDDLASHNNPSPGNIADTCKDLIAGVTSEQDGLKESLFKCCSEKANRKSEGRKSFSSHGNTRSLQLLKEHICALQKLGEDFTKRFIIDLRGEICVMWEKCCYGEVQRSSFTSYNSAEFSDEVLVEHENELKRLKEYYSTHKELYKLVSKRKKLWNEKVTFENPPDGCLRFENRGGTLIKELKRYQVVEKQLPIVEKDIKTKIKAWEKANKTKFQMYDLQYVEYIETQKQEYKAQQEAKRAAKKAAKHEELMADVSASSVPGLKKSSVSDSSVSKASSKELNQESLKELMRPTSASLLKSRNFSTPAARSRLSVHSSSLKRSAPASKVSKASSDAAPPKVSKLDLSDTEEGSSTMSSVEKENSKENLQMLRTKTPRTESNIKIRPVLQTSAMKRKLQRRSLTLKQTGGEKSC